MDLGKTIFISDMDETLFDDDKQISAKNKEAIVDYQKKVDSSLLQQEDLL